MEYFKKVRNAAVQGAMQGMQLIQNVTAAVSDVTLATSKRPQDEFLFRFRVACQLIDHYASLDDADSVEADKALHASKVRDHLREMVSLLHEEDENWAQKSLATAEREEDSDDGCLEAFLQFHVMQELCSRALKDRPRGCMTIILGAATSILRNVRYPLLPHQTVHVPLGQLISMATRYDSLCSGKPGSVNYKKRIDLSLTTLISVIWRKISDNPALLDFFYFVDHRMLGDSHGDAKAGKIRSQLDVLTALIPLMGKQRVGPYAKEAMLLALSMHDDRVERFVVHETSLLQNVISELTRKFVLAVDSMSTPPSGTGAPVVFKQPGTNFGLDSSSRGLQSESSSVPVSSTSAPSAIVSQESFLKVLKFCNAICVAVSGGEPECSSSRRPDQQTLELTEEALSSTNTLSSNVYKQIMTHFETAFLQSCLRPALAANGEGQVLAAQGLLRRTILELSRGSAGSSMLTVLTQYLCTDKELLTVFVARAGSVSRPVAVSTMQLLGTLLGASPLEEAMSLMLEDRDREQRELITAASLDVGASALDFSQDEVENLPNDTHASAIAIEEPLQDSVLMASASDVHLRLSPLDAKLALVCEGLRTKGMNCRVQSGNKSSSKSNESSQSDSETQNDSNLGLDAAAYTDAAAQAILNRLSGRLSALIALIRSHDESHDECLPQTDAKTKGSGHGLLMGLVIRKLSLFLTLRLDEQLAVTGLIEKCICLLCAAIIASPGTRRHDLDRLESVLSVLSTVEKLWTEVSSHMDRVQDSAQKMTAAKYLLVSEGSGTGRVDTSTEVHHKKLLEREGPVVRRMLETAVIVRELLAEVQGAINAVSLLRRGLVEVVESPEGGVTTIEDVDEVEKEEYTVDLEVDHGLESEGETATVDVTEESFLEDCDDVEKALDQMFGDGKDIPHDFCSVVEAEVDLQLVDPVLDMDDSYTNSL